MKKVLTWLIAIALLVGAVAGTIFLCQKNNDKRSLKVDSGLGKEIVFVIDKNDKEQKETDITKLKYVNVGDIIKVDYDGSVFVGSKADVEKGFAGLTISGVEKTGDNTYIVVDNVVISIVVELPTTISPEN